MEAIKSVSATVTSAEPLNDLSKTEREWFTLVAVAALPVMLALAVMNPAPFVNWFVLFGMLMLFAALPS